jgi:endonuclease/exonuclease/phosphatase family metal-dependent hydrolase
MNIKIVCLNVWIGGVLFEPMLEYLQKENADIYLLQEVFNGEDPDLSPQYRTFTELQKRLNLPEAHFAPCFIEDIDGKQVVQGNAVLSKFPLEEVSISHYDAPFGKRNNTRNAFHLSPRNLQHVKAKLNNQEIHVLNTQGIWGEDGLDSPRRLKMVEHIIEEIGNNSPLVLAGDFNMRPETEAIALIEKKLHNVFKNELETSFNLKRKDLENYPGFASAVVDMLFVTPDLKIIGHESPTVDVSDHRPLVVKLAFS